jgi:hypothetical protein
MSGTPVQRVAFRLTGRKEIVNRKRPPCFKVNLATKAYLQSFLLEESEVTGKLMKKQSTLKQGGRLRLTTSMGSIPK